jgi:uncharacterized protein YdhG (YjbR/CyaY superfamily)
MARDFDDYLSTLPNQQRAVLQQLRERTHAAIPAAAEMIKTRKRPCSTPLAGCFGRFPPRTDQPH